MNQTGTRQVCLVNGASGEAARARVMAQTQVPGTVAACVNQQIKEAQPAASREGT